MTLPGIRCALPAAVAAMATVSCHRTPPAAERPAPLMTRAALRAGIDSMLADPMWRNTNWGILVVDPVARDTLYAHNAGKLFMPASNQKLLSGSVALAQLGAEYRFTTVFLASGPIDEGVLTGDLVVVGRGDPTMSDVMMGDAMTPLRAAAESLWSRGVRAIAGALVKGGNAFPDTTIGPWTWTNLDTPSGAAVDELFFNNGVARVTVIGGDAPGDPVRVRTRPARTVPVVVAEFVTGEPLPSAALDAAGRGAGGRGGRGGGVRAATDLRGPQPVVRLTGRVAPRDSATVQVAIKDPASVWLGAFAEALAERGITLRGGIIRTPDAVITNQILLFTMSSPTLAEILPRFLKPSQNQIGEILLRVLGLERAGVGSADSGRRVIERQLVEWGADTAGFVVSDGSGLSRYDYVTPETIVRILDVMRTRSDFQLFYDALPVAGVDGTISNRMRETPAQGNVRAKTGTVDRSHSLSGYVTTPDKRLLLFSFQCNNYTVTNAQVERVQDQIAAWLAGVRITR